MNVLQNMSLTEESILYKYNKGQSLAEIGKERMVSRQSIHLSMKKELISFLEDNPEFKKNLDSFALDKTGALHFALNLFGREDSRVLLLLLKSQYGYFFAGGIFAFKEQYSIDSMRVQLLSFMKKPKGQPALPLKIPDRTMIISRKEDLLSLVREDYFSHFFCINDDEYIVGYGRKSVLQNLCLLLRSRKMKGKDIPYLLSLFPDVVKRKEGFLTNEDFYDFMLGKKNYIYGMPCRDKLIPFLKSLEKDRSNKKYVHKKFKG